MAQDLTLRLLLSFGPGPQAVLRLRQTWLRINATRHCPESQVSRTRRTADAEAIAGTQFGAVALATDDCSTLPGHKPGGPPSRRPLS